MRQYGVHHEGGASHSLNSVLCFNSVLSAWTIFTVYSFVYSKGCSLLGTTSFFPLSALRDIMCVVTGADLFRKERLQSLNGSALSSRSHGHYFEKRTEFHLSLFIVQSYLKGDAGKQFDR